MTTDARSPRVMERIASLRSARLEPEENASGQLPMGPSTVDETVFLGSRVMVMSARPGRIVLIAQRCSPSWEIPGPRSEFVRRPSFYPPWTKSAQPYSRLRSHEPANPSK